jgi:hypothetical protein
MARCKVCGRQTERLDSVLCEDCYARGAYNEEKDIRNRGGCFITSACVSAMNLPDNCYELETLRAFRDNVLLTDDSGKKLVKKYYKIAPEIVSMIDKDSKRKEIYRKVYAEIKNIVSLIEQKKKSEAIREYSKIVDNLQSRYTIAS